MKPPYRILLLLIVAFSALLAACGGASEPATPTPGVGLANPASVNCVEQGGQVVIQTDGSGGQYGVCLFDDNRQCEEWAMFRGNCPVGGLKVTGYITEAAVFCAITGGQYAVTANSGQADETGDCALPDGLVCNADDYFNRTCVPRSE